MSNTTMKDRSVLNAWKACVRKDSGVQISPSALWLSSKNSIPRNLCPLNKLRLSRRSVGERCWMKNEIIDFGVLDA
jgi:hypothetical protein